MSNLPNLAWHAKSETEVLKKFNSSFNGLTSEEVVERTKKYGLNELPEKKKLNPVILYIQQLNNLMIYILIVAAIISYLFKQLIDFYIIIFVIILNTGIGFIQEYKAERAINALKKMIVSYAKVYRNGELVKIPSNKLVPGDIIYLES